MEPKTRKERTTQYDKLLKEYKELEAQHEEIVSKLTTTCNDYANYITQVNSTNRVRIESLREMINKPEYDTQLHMLISIELVKLLLEYIPEINKKTKWEITTEWHKTP